MKLTYLRTSVRDLAPAAAFYRDQLGLSEAWREGDDTIAFWLADRSAQIMVDVTDEPTGPMYLVDDVGAWLTEHPDVPVQIDRYQIPGGSVVGVADVAANVFYVFDQPDA